TSARELAVNIPGMVYAIDRGLEMRSQPTTVAASTAYVQPLTNTARVQAPLPPISPPQQSYRPPVAPPPVTQTAYTSPPVAVPATARRNPIPSGIRVGRYCALVIGNNNYQHLPKLQTAVNDANALSELLQSRYGYEVTTLLNASRAEILQTLALYRRILEDDDNLLIYYAGHGWLDEEADRGYWLPVDATQDDDVFWIANESVTSTTRAMSAKHVMIIADSCNSGKLNRCIHVNQTKPGYLKQLARRRARVVLTSGGVEPVSDAGGRDNHSIFAAALLRALEGNADVLEGHELFTKIRRPVAVNSDQVPEYSDMRKAGHDGGDFIFILK
ncbi:MAG: caspase family protein, partial [Deltaproteobacteria bacterium]|nr:caspase family protein [Deltaproteobacteria bacterium]